MTVPIRPNDSEAHLWLLRYGRFPTPQGDAYQGSSRWIFLRFDGVTLRPRFVHLSLSAVRQDARQAAHLLNSLKLCPNRHVPIESELREHVPVPPQRAAAGCRA